jgi:hypothetical protein
VLAPSTAVEPGRASGLASAAPASTGAAAQPQQEQGLNFGLFAGRGPAPEPPVVKREPVADPTAKAKLKPKGFGGPLPGKRAGAVPGPRVDVGQPEDPDNSKSKGRPKRDLVATCEVLINEFEEAKETDNQYFGQTFKTHRRYCNRLAADTEARANETKDMVEWKSLSKCVKQVTVIVALCDGLQKHAVTSPSFGSAYDQQVQFLQMAPEAEVRLPSGMSPNWIRHHQV